MSGRAGIPALIFVLAVFGALAARAGDTLKFEPAVVTVSGLCLGDLVFLGAGKMIKDTVLHLDEPVTVEGNAESADSKGSVSNVRQILLEAGPDVDLEDLHGKWVTLEGRLFHAPSEYHHTEVLMKVDKVLGTRDR